MVTLGWTSEFWRDGNHEMFYTEHDFQVDLEYLRVQLEISCRENTTYVCVFLSTKKF